MTTFCDVQEYDKAIQCAEKLKKELPNEHKVEKEYGDCLRKKSRYSEALQAYERALQKWQANRFSKEAQDKANYVAKACYCLQESDCHAAR